VTALLVPPTAETGAKRPRPANSLAVAVAIAKRVVSGLIVLWGAATLTFIGLQLAPGDIVDILAGETVSDQTRAAIAAQWGLDQPVLVQYLDYLGKLLRFDLGQSYVMRQPVADVLGSQIMPTVALAVSAVLLSVVAAVALAVTTAGRGPIARGLASGLELLAVSVPVFWWGIVLIITFSFNLKLFPVVSTGSWTDLVLPTITLAIPTTGLLTQVLRTSMESALEEPFAMTIRARGVGEFALRLRHALRHAAVSTMNLAGWLLGGLLGGAVITEQVFGRSGLGTATLGAVTNKDIPVVMAIVLLVAFIYVLTSTIVDVLAVVIERRNES
jgi:peptide/nickel transport system permease protein